MKKRDEHLLQEQVRLAFHLASTMTPPFRWPLLLVSIFLALLTLKLTVPTINERVPRGRVKETTTKHIDSRDALIYKLPIALTSPVPTSLRIHPQSGQNECQSYIDCNYLVSQAPPHFAVKIRFGDSTQTVKIDSSTDNVNKTIEDAFKKFQMRKMVPDGKDPQDYILKVTGFEEYLYGMHKTIEFDCIRSLLQKQLDVRITSFVLLCELIFVTREQVDHSLFDISDFKLRSKMK